MKRVDLKKILYMDFLIRHKCTGTSKEFAAKMDMSRSTLFEYIAYMRDELEVCILFDKFLGTYYYDGKKFDLQNIFQYMRAIINFLDSCDSMLDAIADYESEMHTYYDDYY